MKVQDNDLSKESLGIQEFAEDTTNILNNGNYEVQTTNSSSPDFDAPQESVLVLSVFGAQRRLYISYLGSWYYTSLTLL